MRVRPRPALVVALVAALGLLAALPALGALSFRGPTNVAVGLTPVSVAVGDLDGDTNLDLAVANFFSASVSVLLGDGVGWRYRFDDGEESSVRGVNLMHVRDGKIVELLAT